jgi:hypothetical protein
VKLVFPHHQTWFPHVGLGHSTFAAVVVEFLATFGMALLHASIMICIYLFLNRVRDLQCDECMLAIVSYNIIMVAHG